MLLALLLTLGAVLSTLYHNPSRDVLSRWDFTGGVFCGALGYWILTMERRTNMTHGLKVFIWSLLGLFCILVWVSVIVVISYLMS